LDEYNKQTTRLEIDQIYALGVAIANADRFQTLTQPALESTPGSRLHKHYRLPAL
jgi:hypothetical protein